jgi:excisionase family DNA binding protein
MRPHVSNGVRPPLALPPALVVSSPAVADPMTNSDQQYLYDIPTAARLLSTNVWAVRKLIHDGKLKFVPLGKAFLISPEAIREFIRKREITRGEKL